MSKALTDLLAKVEAGAWPEDWREVTRAISLRPDDRHLLAQKAFNGSLDAAKALHEAVLPEWVVNHLTIWGDFCRIELCQTHLKDGGMWHGSNDLSIDAENRLPARAWLIAIIKALIAKETAQ